MSSSSGWAIFGYVVAAIFLWCFLAHCVFMRVCVCCKRRTKLRLEAESELVLDPERQVDHPRWKLLSAHRGGAAEACENTIDAFKYALSLGMNFMECDVQLSKDGQVVIAHDANLERMCGPEYADKHIIDYNFTDLPHFQRSIMMHTAEGSYDLKEHEEGKFCLLEDLFKICDGVYISIDLKNSSDLMVEQVESLINNYKREQYTIWGSMYKE